MKAYTGGSTWLDEMVFGGFLVLSSLVAYLKASLECFTRALLGRLKAKVRANEGDSGRRGAAVCPHVSPESQSASHSAR